MMIIIRIFIYLIGMGISFFTFAFTGSTLDYVGILSQGAILATFGSALITVADIFERDKLERVKLNNKILYNDIKHIEQWIRWGFLPRRANEKLLDKKSITIDLKNPVEVFDVGTHEISVTLPTVLEDFFDLPVISDFKEMKRFESAFKTKYTRDAKENNLNSSTNNSYIEYMCVYDILRSACIFKLARILKHFSIALIIGSVIITVICLNRPSMIGCLKSNTIQKNEIKTEVANDEKDNEQIQPKVENENIQK